MQAYLDNSATTKCAPEVVDVCVKVMSEDYGNPSSKHMKGVEAENYIKEAKETIAKTLKCQEKEILFTSGGTESDNWAIKAAAQMLKEILPYMQISTDNSESTSTTKTITLPNVTNKTVAEAEKLLKNAGFTVSTSASSTDIVTEQYPTKGYELVKGSIVKLYTETENTRVSKQVPDLTGKSLYQVKTLLKELNLNYSVTGSGTVVSQEPIANTSVEEGTIIKVTLGK